MYRKAADDLNTLIYSSRVPYVLILTFSDSHVGSNMAFDLLIYLLCFIVWNVIKYHLKAIQVWNT